MKLHISEVLVEVSVVCINAYSKNTRIGISLKKSGIELIEVSVPRIDTYSKNSRIGISLRKKVVSKIPLKMRSN